MLNCYSILLYKKQLRLRDCVQDFCRQENNNNNNNNALHNLTTSFSILLHIEKMLYLCNWKEDFKLLFAKYILYYIAIVFKTYIIQNIDL